MSRVALIAALFLGYAVVTGTSLAEEQPKNSPAAGKLLQAADTARQAKNYAECIVKAKEAQALPTKNAYDSFLASSLLMAAYAAQGNTTEAVPYMEQVVESPYQPAAAKGQILKYLMSYAYQQKSYEKSIAYAERVRAAGDSSEDTAVLIAQSYYLLGKYKEAMSGMESVIARAEQAGKKPSEKGLNVIWSCAVKLKDQMYSALERLDEIIELDPDLTTKRDFLDANSAYALAVSLFDIAEQKYQSEDAAARRRDAADRASNIVRRTYRRKSVEVHL